MEGIEAAPGVRAITYTLDRRTARAARPRRRLLLDSAKAHGEIQVASRVTVGPGRITGSSPWHPLLVRGRGIFLGLGVDDRERLLKVRQFYVRYAREQMAMGVFGIASRRGAA